MSIDGLGRPPPPSPPAPGASPAQPSGQAGFSVEAKAAATGVQASGPLAELQRGALSVDQYLDARVEEAIAPFANRLPAESLEFMRSSLREQLASDPALVELVSRATGQKPPANEP